MKNNEIIKQITTANENILRNIISKKNDVFGNAKTGIVFKVDFGNENRTNERSVSFPIKNLEQAIQIIKEIDVDSSDKEFKLRQIFNRESLNPEGQLFLNCNFRRSDSFKNQILA